MKKIVLLLFFVCGFVGSKILSAGLVAPNARILVNKPGSGIVGNVGDWVVMKDFARLAREAGFCVFVSMPVIDDDINENGVVPAVDERTVLVVEQPNGDKPPTTVRFLRR